MVQGISVDFRLPFPERRNQSELRWRNPDFLLEFADQRVVEALAVFNVSSDRIPMARPNFLPRRTQAEKHFAI
jgi:hypothetical protein